MDWKWTVGILLAIAATVVPLYFRRRRVAVAVRLFRPRFNGTEGTLVWKAVNVGARPVTLVTFGILPRRLTRAQRVEIGKEPMSLDDSHLPCRLGEHDDCHVGQDLAHVCERMRQAGFGGRRGVRPYFCDIVGRIHVGRPFSVNIEDASCDLQMHTGVPQRW